MKECHITHGLRRVLALYRRPFVRHVVIAASGAAGVQAVGVLFAPLITRLYGPEVFGLFGAFMALIAAVVPMAALAYPVAIVLPGKDRDAAYLAVISMVVALGLAGLLGFVLWAMGERIATLLGVLALQPYMVLIPPVMFFVALQQIAQQWLIRNKQFAVMARIGVVYAFLLNIAKSGMGWFRPLTAVLIGLTAIGSALHVFLLGMGVKRAAAGRTPPITELPAIRTLWNLAKKYRDFPLYRAPQTTINALTQSLPVIMLAAYFGTASAGFYTLCTKTIGMATFLIGKSVGDVFYPRIAEAVRSGENITRLIARTTAAMAGVAVVPFALVIAFGPWLFGWIFGAEWVVAGDYARWISLWLFGALMNRPSVAAIPALSMQGVFLVYEIISIALRVAAIMIGFHWYANDVAAVALFSLVGLLLNLTLITVVLRKSGSEFKKARL